MRLIFFLVIILSAGPAHSQVTYTSYYTESYPSIFTSKVELINRSITMGPNTVIIATEVSTGKEIELLTVQEILNMNGKLILSCTTKNRAQVTISLVDQEPVKVIDYYGVNSKTGEEYQLRFHIQTIKPLFERY